MIYVGELKINLHYGRKVIPPCIIISFCLPPCTVQALHRGQGFVVDTPDSGEVACMGHGAWGWCGLGRRARAHCPQEKLPASEYAPEGSGAVLAFRIKPHKTNGCKWPFPNLTMQ